MPVTAKLLRGFYETLGQEITGELVNWAIFQRFDERLERRMAEVRADSVKWMFTLWAGRPVTTVATVWGVVSLLR